MICAVALGGLGSFELQKATRGVTGAFGAILSSVCAARLPRPRCVANAIVDENGTKKQPGAHDGSNATKIRTLNGTVGK